MSRRGTFFPCFSPVIITWGSSERAVLLFWHCLVVAPLLHHQSLQDEKLDIIQEHSNAMESVENKAIPFLFEAEATEAVSVLVLTVSFGGGGGAISFKTLSIGLAKAASI